MATSKCSRYDYLIVKFQNFMRQINWSNLKIVPNSNNNLQNQKAKKRKRQRWSKKEKMCQWSRVSCLFSPLKPPLQSNNSFQLQIMTHSHKLKMRSSWKSPSSQQRAVDEPMTALLRPQRNSKTALIINPSLVRVPMVSFTKPSKQKQVLQSPSKRSKLTTVTMVSQALLFAKLLCSRSFETTITLWDW